MCFVPDLKFCMNKLEEQRYLNYLHRKVTSVFTEACPITSHYSSISVYQCRYLIIWSHLGYYKCCDGLPDISFTPIFHQLCPSRQGWGCRPHTRSIVKPNSNLRSHLSISGTTETNFASIVPQLQNIAVFSVTIRFVQLSSLLQCINSCMQFDQSQAKYKGTSPC